MSKYQDQSQITLDTPDLTGTPADWFERAALLRTATERALGIGSWLIIAGPRGYEFMEVTTAWLERAAARANTEERRLKNLLSNRQQAFKHNRLDAETSFPNENPDRIEVDRRLKEGASEKDLQSWLEHRLISTVSPYRLFIQSTVTPPAWTAESMVTARRGDVPGAEGLDPDERIIWRRRKGGRWMRVEPFLSSHAALNDEEMAELDPAAFTITENL